jgi:hypothetical protein
VVLRAVIIGGADEDGDATDDDDREDEELKDGAEEGLRDNGASIGEEEEEDAAEGAPQADEAEELEDERLGERGGRNLNVMPRPTPPP